MELKEVILFLEHLLGEEVQWKENSWGWNLAWISIEGWEYKNLLGQPSLALTLEYYMEPQGRHRKVLQSLYIPLAEVGEEWERNVKKEVSRARRVAVPFI